MADATVTFDSVVKHFESLSDPRQTRNRRHLLTDIVVIAVCGVIVGCEGPTAIIRWAKAKKDWLEQFLELPNGIPSRDCLRRVLSMLNPKVDDIPEEYSRKVGNVRLLALGGVQHGGEGCICPTTSLIKALLTHLVLGSKDALVMDMDAGIEHLGRATTQSMDALIVVVDGSPWSVQTALRVRSLAKDIGIKKLVAVVNRASESTDIEGVRVALEGIPIIGTVPYDDRLPGGIVLGADKGGLKPSDALTRALPDIDRILQQLQ